MKKKDPPIDVVLATGGGNERERLELGTCTRVNVVQTDQCSGRTVLAPFELGMMVVSEMCVAIPSLNINEKIKMQLLPKHHRTIPVSGFLGVKGIHQGYKVHV
jgi:hypothetical protein